MCTRWNTIPVCLLNCFPSIISSHMHTQQKLAILAHSVFAISLNNSQTHLALTFRPSFTSMIMCQHATPTPTPCSVSHHIQSVEHMDWTSFFTFVLNCSTIPKLKIPPKLRSILKLIKSLLTPLFTNFYDIIFISSTSTSRIRSSIACQYLIFRYKYSKLPYK